MDRILPRRPSWVVWRIRVWPAAWSVRVTGLFPLRVAISVCTPSASPALIGGNRDLRPVPPRHAGQISWETRAPVPLRCPSVLVSRGCEAKAGLPCQASNMCQVGDQALVRPPADNGFPSDRTVLAATVALAMTIYGRWLGPALLAACMGAGLAGGCARGRACSSHSGECCWGAGRPCGRERRLAHLGWVRPHLPSSLSRSGSHAPGGGGR